MIAVAPLFGLLAACGSTDQSKSGQTVAQLFSSEARAQGATTPAPTEVAARGRGGPKIRDKAPSSARSVAPADNGAAAAPCPTPEPDASARQQASVIVRRDNSGTASTTPPSETVNAANAERRRGPIERVGMPSSARTTAPSNATDAAPAATPCPAPATDRRRGPKERNDPPIG